MKYSINFLCINTKSEDLNQYRIRKLYDDYVYAETPQEAIDIAVDHILEECKSYGAIVKMDGDKPSYRSFIAYDEETKDEYCWEYYDFEAQEVEEQE